MDRITFLYIKPTIWFLANNSLDRLLHDAEGIKRKLGNKLGFTDGIGSAVHSDPRATLGKKLLLIAFVDEGVLALLTQ